MFEIFNSENTLSSFNIQTYSQNVNWPKDCFQMSMFIVMISSWIGFLMMDMQQKQQTTQTKT